MPARKVPAARGPGSTAARTEAPVEAHGETAAVQPAPGLHIVSTPIGNMGDITRRALDVMRAADLIACEDTRHTGLLLHRLEIETRMVSYHDHNKLRRTPELLEMLRQGKSIVLVADAGTPGISDPGFYLIRAAVAAGVRIIPIPGASALLSALVVSGLPCDRFAFEGFLHRREGRRRKRLETLADEPRTMVFFEPGRRLSRLLKDILQFLGDREAVICREMTKLHEEVIRGTVTELIEKTEERELKGEITLVVAGNARDA